MTPQDGKGTPRAGWSTPLLHVRDVAASIRFYEKLGFDFIDAEGENGSIGWARVHCEGGALMFLRAEPGHEMKPAEQGILLILYTEDLPSLRAHLLTQGIECPEIEFPDFMPSGALTLRDPDGYCVGINHWSQKEHDQWLLQIPTRQAQWAKR